MTTSEYAPQDVPAPRLYRITQLHKMFGLPRDLLYRAIKGGELAPVNVGSVENPAYFLTVADVQTWLDSRRGGTK